MAVRTLVTTRPGLKGVPPEEPTRLQLRSFDTKYRLVVLASSAVETVREAGGWLFDRALAGCEVTALVANHSDVRGLRILGVTTINSEEPQESRLRSVQPDAIAVSVDLYRRDPRTQQAVLEALETGSTNVIMFGDAWPEEFDGLGGSVHHRLSIAARAFKAQALIAAAEPAESIEDLETFRCLDVRACRAACLHLVAAS